MNISKQVQDIIQLEEQGIIEFQFGKFPIAELLSTNEAYDENGNVDISRNRLMIKWDREEHDEEQGITRLGGYMTHSDNYNKDYHDVEDALNSWLVCETPEKLEDLINDHMTPVELKKTLKEVLDAQKT